MSGMFATKKEEEPEKPAADKAKAAEAETVEKPKEEVPNITSSSGFNLPGIGG